MTVQRRYRRARRAVLFSGIVTVAGSVGLMQSAVVFAQTEGASIDRLIESLSSTQSLQADFRQTTITVGRAAVAPSKSRVVSGSFAIARPGLLRWEVTKPYAQLQLLDGQQFWLYDPDLAQVSVRPLSVVHLSGLAGLLLNSTGLTRAELAQRYEMRQQPDRDGLSWIQMTPLQPEPGVVKIVVGIDPGAMLRQVEITDALQQVTRLELSNVVKNATINPALFRFVPPKGVSVLRTP